MNNTPFTTVRDILRHAVTRFNTEGLAFGHGGVFAKATTKQRVGHGGNVVVRKTQIGADEIALAWGHAGHPQESFRPYDVSRDELFDQRHRASNGADRRRDDFAGQALLVVGEQASSFDHVVRQTVEPLQQLGNFNAPDA